MRQWRRRMAKRYFKVDLPTSMTGLEPGAAYQEFDGEEPTRQAERYGKRWFTSRKDYHPGLGPGLVDLPLSELELDPADEITAEEFEAAWIESGRYEN